MTKAEVSYSGLLITALLVVGAFLTGAISLAEGAAIPVTIFQVTLVFGFIYFAISRLAQQNIKINLYGLEAYYLVFLCLIFFSLIYSPEREQGIFYSIRISILVLMTYLIFNSVTSRKEIKILAIIIIGVAGVISVHTLYQTYLNPEIIAFNYLNAGKNLMRAHGTETDPNIFAINFAMPVMLLMALYNTTGKIIIKSGYLILMGLILAAILITYSRSAWVSIIAGIIIVMYYQKNFRLILYSLILFAILLLFSSTLQNLAHTVFERFLNIFAGSSDDSSNIRILLAIGAIRMFFDSYLVGIGFQGFSTNFQNYYTPQQTIGIYEPHNEYYTILAELGLIGFLLFSVIIGKLLSWGFKSIKLRGTEEDSPITIALTASFISYLIFYMFYGGMLYNSLFMINVGLMLTLYHINLNTTNRKFDTSANS